MQLSRTLQAALLGGSFAGFAHALLVYGLFSLFEYQAVVPNAPMAAILLGSFCLGFVAIGCSLYTRLLTPGIGFGALVTVVSVVELTTPGPERIGELGGAIVVDGAFYVLWYAESWAVWLSLLLVGTIAEYAIRSRYELGSDGVRPLPTLSRSRSTGITLVGTVSVLVGIAVLTQLEASHNWDLTASILGGGFATMATAIALGAVLGRGLLAPVALYTVVVPTAMGTEVFTAPDSGMHVLAIGMLAAASIGIVVIETSIRTGVRRVRSARALTDGTIPSAADSPEHHAD
ncbi:hypothetical protein Halru_2239 [Halovivax ruber XH-70]|uniref:Uncharacterized protein n=1 Tax=Halovivax ruber (strain DSM 18193 / JCM 13892 / XH-70) TaxID=797302 RepID=L0IBA3_HALRX|nr:hypothetical protein [Halovivax ruber]AGB16825.1 hypothetical protein Halru_2239 [Halovivax ruber XH-70]